MIVLTEFQEQTVSDSITILSNYPHSLINNAVPGTGKTYVTLATIKKLQLTNILVITPKSVVSSWTKSIDRFFDSDKPNFTIMHFEQINHVVSTELKRTKFDAIVFDEIHKLKNRRTNTWLQCVGLQANIRIGLTGTPVINRPNDLYAIFQVLRLNRVIAHTETQNDFESKILHMKKTQWESICLGFTKTNLDYLNEFFESLNKYCVRIRADYLPQTVTKHVSINTLTDKTMSLLSANLASEKLEWITNFINNTSTKVIVFSKYKSVLDEIEKVDNLQSIMYHGGLNKNQRDKVINDFIHNGTNVLLATIGSMGTGVDGLQTVCNNIVFMDKPFNPPEIEQAIARVARKGQLNTVHVYFLDGTDHIEKQFMKINANKQKTLIQLKEKTQK